MASVSGASPAVKQTADVFRFDEGDTEGGTATLTRTNSGVTMTISTTVGGEMWDLPFTAPPDDDPLDASWEVGDATTNWFVVFSNPDGCTDPCGEDDVLAAIADIGDEDDDLGGPADASVHYAAGHVAGSTSWHAAGSLREGDASGMIFPSVPLLDAMTAEVHIIVHPHG